MSLPPGENPIEKLRAVAARECRCGSLAEGYKRPRCLACDARRELRWIEGRAVDALRWLRRWHVAPAGEEKPEVEGDAHYTVSLKVCAPDPVPKRAGKRRKAAG